MSFASWLYVGLAVTTLLLVASIVSGKLGKRKAHLWWVIVTGVSLFITIWLAKEAGKHYNFPEDRHAIHMPLARLAFVLLLGPLITGPLHWFGKVSRRAHLIPVILFVVAVLAAFGTGAWMMAGATEK